MVSFRDLSFNLSEIQEEPAYKKRIFESQPVSYARMQFPEAA